MTKKELEALKITELRSLAHKSSVSLRRTWSKAEIVAAILRITKPKRGRKPKPAVKTRKITSGTKAKTAASKKKQKKTKLKTSQKALTSAVMKKTSAAAQTATAKKATLIPQETAAKQVTPTVSALALAKNKVTLMVRDASTLFAYWSISGAGTTAKQPDIMQDAYINLRLWDLTSKGNNGAARDYYDIPVTDLAGKRYIEVRLPGHRFMCEIGIITSKDKFLVLARSKEVETPPDRLEAFPPEAEKFYREAFGLYPGEALLLKDIYLRFPTSR